jgi:diguanylate cyclase
VNERNRTPRTRSHRPTSSSRADSTRRWTALFAPERPVRAVPTVEERDLVAAARAGELEVYYQVIVDREQRPAGAEALLRWNRPGHGVVNAASFLPLVQSHELQRQITELVLGDLVTALPVLRSVINASRTYFAINAPARQVQDSMFPSRVAAYLRAENVEAAGVVVELTDPNDVTDWRAIHEAGVELRRLEIDLAVDDAGAEPGDLLYRDRCDAPIVKLDRMMVGESRRWTHERRVVEATVRLCKASSYTVIAQGVEDEQTATWLHELGVDFQQGFFHGRPEPLHDLVARLAT